MSESGRHYHASTRSGRGPVVLGLDAAVPPASVALVASNGELLAEEEGPFGRGTDGWILPAIDRLFERSSMRFEDLEAIAAGSGPGAFTGIRVALATAIGLGGGSDLPVAGVSSCDGLAEAALPSLPGCAGLEASTNTPEPILVTIDARRGELYAALLGPPGSPPQSLLPRSRPWRTTIWGPCVLPSGDLLKRIKTARPSGGWLSCGTGPCACPELLEVTRHLATRTTLAAANARLLWRLLVDQPASRGPNLPPVLPTYVRPPV